MRTTNENRNIIIFIFIIIIMWLGVGMMLLALDPSYTLRESCSFASPSLGEELCSFSTKSRRVRQWMMKKKKQMKNKTEAYLGSYQIHNSHNLVVEFCTVRAVCFSTQEIGERKNTTKN